MGEQYIGRILLASVKWKRKKDPFLIQSNLFIADNVLIDIAQPSSQALQMCTNLHLLSSTMILGLLLKVQSTKKHTMIHNQTQVQRTILKSRKTLMDIEAYQGTQLNLSTEKHNKIHNPI